MAEGRLTASPEATLARVNDLLVAQGWRARAQVRSNGTMVAARRGMAGPVRMSALLCLGTQTHNLCQEFRIRPFYRHVLNDLGSSG